MTFNHLFLARKQKYFWAGVHIQTKVKIKAKLFSLSDEILSSETKLGYE